MILNNVLTVNALDRVYSTIIKEQAEALVLLLHPAAGSGKSTILQGGWDKVEWLSLLAPWGWVQHPERSPAINNATCWSSDEEPVIGRQIDDVQFIDEMLDFELSKNKFKQIVLVGHSNGCAMGFKLLAQSKHRDKFVAAVLSSAPWASKKTQLNIPLLYITSDSDPIRPLNGGGYVQTPWFSLTPTPVMDTVNECLTHLRCDPDSLLVSDHIHYTKSTWQGENSFEYIVFKGQGHYWPNGKDIPDSMKAVIGPVNLHLNATELSLSFIRKMLKI